MKKSAIVLAVMLTMAVIPTTALADKPDKPGGPPYYAPTTCAEVDDPYGYWGAPDDGELLLQGIGDCNDVSSLATGSTFEFKFEAIPPASKSTSDKARGKARPVSVTLAVRNSLGGEWCDGAWSVDGGDSVVGENLIVDPAAVGTVTLQITEELDSSGNCADRKGDVKIFDDDPGHVVTAWTTGKELDGTMTVTFTLTGPTPPQ